MTVQDTLSPVHEKLLVFIRESKYEGQLPRFYDPSFFPELNPVMQQWEAIRDEVFEYEKKFGPIKGMDTYSPPGLTDDTGWSNLYFDNFMWRKHSNRKHFPLICSLLDNIPNCTYGAISILGPGASILPHYGDTNGIVRCHLGLDVPAEAPLCAIQVGDEVRGWSNGAFTIFTEAHLHTTWNKSSKKRYVLVVDLVPHFFSEDRLEISSKVLAAQTYNFFEKRIPVFKMIPLPLLKFVHGLLTFAWRCYLPLQRRL